MNENHMYALTVGAVLCFAGVILLATHPVTRNLPVIVLTMETAAGVRRQMLALGAEAFVSKPVRWHDLFAEIGRCVPLPNKLLLDYNIPDLLATTQPQLLSVAPPSSSSPYEPWNSGAILTRGRASGIGLRGCRE